MFSQFGAFLKKVSGNKQESQSEEDEIVIATPENGKPETDPTASKKDGMKEGIEESMEEGMNEGVNEIMKEDLAMDFIPWNESSLLVNQETGDFLPLSNYFHDNMGPLLLKSKFCSFGLKPKQLEILASLKQTLNDQSGKNEETGTRQSIITGPFGTGKRTCALLYAFEYLYRYCMFGPQGNFSIVILTRNEQQSASYYFALKSMKLCPDAKDPVSVDWLRQEGNSFSIVPFRQSYALPVSHKPFDRMDIRNIARHPEAYDPASLYEPKDGIDITYHIESEESQGHGSDVLLCTVETFCQLITDRSSQPFKPVLDRLLDPKLIILDESLNDNNLKDDNTCGLANSLLSTLESAGKDIVPGSKEWMIASLGEYLKITMPKELLCLSTETETETEKNFGNKDSKLTQQFQLEKGDQIFPILGAKAIGWDNQKLIPLIHEIIMANGDEEVALGQPVIAIICDTEAQKVSITGELLSDEELMLNYKAELSAFDFDLMPNHELVNLSKSIVRQPSTQTPRIYLMSREKDTDISFPVTHLIQFTSSVGSLYENLDLQPMHEAQNIKIYLL